LANAFRALTFEKPILVIFWRARRVFERADDEDSLEEGTDGNGGSGAAFSGATFETFLLALISLSRDRRDPI
jgi:hypothetical protein